MVFISEVGRGFMFAVKFLALIVVFAVVFGWVVSRFDASPTMRTYTTTTIWVSTGHNPETGSP